MARINRNLLVGRLEKMGEMFPALVEGLSEEEVRWKPSPEEWSILEVCCHLLDEEREEFRPRLERTLRNPEEPWPPLDLRDVAQRRGYNQREPGAVLEEFSNLRRASIAWLRGLISPDWSRSHQAPGIGTLRAGDLIAAWAAHDACHLRQIAKRLQGLAARDAGEFHTAYAEP